MKIDLVQDSPEAVDFSYRNKVGYVLTVGPIAAYMDHMEAGDLLRDIVAEMKLRLSDEVYNALLESL